MICADPRIILLRIKAIKGIKITQACLFSTSELCFYLSCASMHESLWWYYVFIRIFWYYFDKQCFLFFIFFIFLPIYFSSQCWRRGIAPVLCGGGGRCIHRTWCGQTTHADPRRRRLSTPKKHSPSGFKGL